jgi:NAD(P)H dehydrogenase (quinone)
LGKPVNYVDIPEDNYAQANLGAGVPKWNVDQFVALEKMKRAGMTAVVSSDTEKLIGRPAMPFLDAIRHQSL